MAEPLKNIINRPLLERAAAAMAVAWPAFDRAGLLSRSLDAQWEERALKERLAHVAQVMRLLLPAAYPEAQAVITGAVQHLLDTEGEKLYFEYGFWPDFSALYGLDHPGIALDALETVTRWTTAEFAIRPFLLRHPAQTQARMFTWATHPSPLVRRLSTEGFRPRLPWGMGIPALKKDPSPVLPVLEILKNDPADTVRRSVANNLNDISKDHPALALDVARRWLGRSAETDWVVRHACRGLLKRGHPEALALFGFDPGQVHIALTGLQAAQQVRIGEVFPFSIALENTGNQPETLRLEYRIDYRKAGGKSSAKVFHLRETVLAPGSELQVSRELSFRDLTTRRHYPGAHRLAVIVNGVVLGEVGFEVL